MAETWRAHLEQALKWMTYATMTNEGTFSNQRVSCAVEAVIHACDALCMQRLGRRSANPDHPAAASLLEEAFRGTDHEKEASKKADDLREILANKNNAQYYAEEIAVKKADKLVEKAARLVRWAQAVLDTP